jgi:hypothetical protein
MLNDFRQSSGEPSQPQYSSLPEEQSQAENGKKFLGMTAKQRFILSLLLLVSICVLGSLCLVVFGRIYFP